MSDKASFDFPDNTTRESNRTEPEFY